MDPRLVPLLDRQYGAVSRQQALGTGMHRNALASHLRAGHLLVAHRGVYVDAGRAATSATRAMAALLAGGPGAVCSGALAAELHGLPVLEVGVPEITVPFAAGRRPRHTLRVRRRHLDVGDLGDVQGLRAVCVRRALIDMLTGDRRDQAVVACDAALRRGEAGVVELESALAGPVAHGRRARQWLRLADPRSESPLETLLRLLLQDAGLGPFDVQAEVRDGARFVARLDLYHRASGVAIEADGRGAHGQPTALYRDRWRQNALQQLGIVVLRFTWYDVTRRPDEVVADVARAIEMRAGGARRFAAPA